MTPDNIPTISPDEIKPMEYDYSSVYPALSKDVNSLKSHINSIRIQIETLSKELSEHDTQAKTEFDHLRVDVGFLKGNIEKTQLCLLEVNEVLDKMTALSNNNTRAVGAASEAVRDLATVLTLNSDKREQFYQQEITAKRDAEREVAKIRLEEENIRNKAKDARMIKWIAIIASILTIASTIIISVLQR